MKIIVKYVYIILSVIFIIYLSLPGYDFPTPPQDSLQSKEPADTETKLRRAYFTDLERDEILGFYLSQFKYSTLLKVPLPTFRLNYPPEEAQTIIRDQTRSTFLEELSHPFRESLFVSGFHAKSEKDTILIQNKVWLHKITVRLIPSSVFWRLLVGISILILIPLISKSMISSTILLKKELSQKWNSR